MADPLSVTASVIAVVVLGVKSTKIIYETISGLSNAHNEFGQAQNSVAALEHILDEICTLAKVTRDGLLQGNQLALLNNDQMKFFKAIVTPLESCALELKDVVEKVEKWQKKYSKSDWKTRLFGTVHHLIKTTDIQQIEKVVVKHLAIFNNHLTMAGLKQNQTLISCQESMQITLHQDIVQNNTTIQASATSIRELVNNEFLHSNRQNGQNTQRITTSLEKMSVEATVNHREWNSEAKHRHAELQSNFRSQEAITSTGFLETRTNLAQQTTQIETGLEQQTSILIQNQEVIKDFLSQQLQRAQQDSQTLQNTILELQQQISTITEATTQQDFEARLQDCVDRLYEIKDSTNGDEDIDSERAQPILEDIVDVLKTLLKKSDLPDLRVVRAKRKFEDDRDDIFDGGVNLDQRRVGKRMRGILDSSLTAQIRQSNWQKEMIPHGPRRKHHNRIFSTTCGTLAITTMHVKSPSKIPEAASENEEEIETFIGSLTLLPGTKGRQMKIRAFFAQRIHKNGGSFNFPPTLSFSAVRPDNAQVFQVIRRGDILGLRQLLDDRKASLTDCDSSGHTLLWHCFRSMQIAAENPSTRSELQRNWPQICAFLIEHGADVNSFEALENPFVDEDGLEPLILWLHRVYNSTNENDRKEVTCCEKLLIEAGADPTLYDTFLSDFFLMQVVRNRDAEFLRLVLHNGAGMLDMEQRDLATGQTALLLAADISRKAPGEENYFTESSFEKMNLLLDYGASGDAQDHEGRNCLHLLFAGGSDGQISIHEIYMPEMLLVPLLTKMINAGASTTTRDLRNRSPTDLVQGTKLERSWRKALMSDVYDPTHSLYYLESESDEIKLITDMLTTIRKGTKDQPMAKGSPFSQWKPKTIQAILTQRLENLAKIQLHKMTGYLWYPELCRHVESCGLSQEWKDAVEACGLSQLSESYDVFCIPIGTGPLFRRLKTRPLLVLQL